MPILANGHLWKFTEFLENKKFSFSRDKILNSLKAKEIEEAYNTISKWNGYRTYYNDFL